MKTLLRTVALYLLILYFLKTLIPGFSISGDFSVYLVGAFTMTVLFLIFKPILNFISLPMNMISLGLSSFFINALLIYLLTILIPHISLTAFTYERLDLGFVIIPKTTFNTFFAYLYTGFLVSCMDGCIKWLIK